MALDFPASPTVGQTYDKWTWDGTAWLLPDDGVGWSDVRARWTRSSPLAFPGVNANIDFDTLVFATTGAPTEAAGVFTVQTPGLYTIDFAVTWGSSSSPAIVAAWLSVTNAEGTARYSSAQVIPTTNGENGWVTNGSATVRLRVGDTFRVQVYTPSGAPAGIAAAEVNVARLSGPVSGGVDPALPRGVVHRSVAPGTDQNGLTNGNHNINGLTGGPFTAEPNRVYKATLSFSVICTTPPGRAQIYVGNNTGVISASVTSQELVYSFTAWATGLSGSVTLAPLMAVLAGTWSISNTFSRNGFYIIEDVGLA